MSGAKLQPTLSRQSLAVSLAGLPLQPPEPDVDEDHQSQEDDVAKGDGKTEPQPVEAKEGYEIADQTLLLPTKRLLIVLAATSTCILLSFLDQTIVATALPTISSYFGAGRDSAWVATAYLVASTATQPLYGRLSDIFGRKIVLLAAVMLFMIFSLACALAQSMLQLIIFRAWQGCFGGGLLTLVMIIMADLISLKDRGKFQGVVEGMIAIANGVGPVVGAVFSEKVSWRWCFWINLPLCGISLVALVIFLPSKPVSGDTKAKLAAIDYGGSIASLTATVLLLMGLTWGGVTYPWKSAPVLVPICLSAVLLVVFLVWEAKFARHPVIPLSVFGNSTASAMQGATFLLGSAYYILLFMIPQFLQTVQGHSAILSSLLLLPFVLMVTVVVESAGLVISKWGRYREFIIFGFAVWAAGCGALTSLRADASIGRIVGFLLLCGIGAGCCVQTTVIAVMASCSDRKAVAVALSTRNYLRLLGGSIFLSVATTIVNNGFRRRLTGIIEPAILQSILDDPIYIQHTLKRASDAATFNTVIAAYVDAFRTLFFVTMGLLLAGLLVTVLFVKHHSLTRDDDKKLKEEGKKFMAEQKAKRKQKGQKNAEQV